MFREDGEIKIVAEGRIPDCPREIDEECRAGQARAEMGLGQTTLERIAERNHGRFFQRSVGLDGQLVRFVFAFSVAGDDTGRR